MVVAERRSDPSLRRAAILLSHLDADNRRRLLAHLPSAEAARLRAAAATLSDVDPLEIRRVVDAFVGRVGSELPRQPAPAPAPTPPSTIKDGAAAHPPAPREAREGPEKLRFLKTVSDGTLLHVLESEHPQTVAVVLASLEAAQAARLLRRFTLQQRTSAIARLGRLDEVPHEVIDDIANHLRASVGDLEAIAGQTGQQHLTSILAELEDDERLELVDGLAKSDRVIAVSLQMAVDEKNKLDRSKENPVIQAHTESTDESELPQEPTIASPRLHQPDAANQIEVNDYQRLASAADEALERLHPKVLRGILAMMDTRDAILTLCGLSPGQVKRLLRTMPRRQVKDVQEKMSQIGNLELKEIDRAKIKAAGLVSGRRMAA